MQHCELLQTIRQYERLANRYYWSLVWQLANEMAYLQNTRSYE
jgi:hypothetical protein